MRWLRQVAILLKRTIEESQRHSTSLLAAALAFYTALSLAPMLLVAVAVAGMWFGQESAKAEIVAAVAGAAGSSAANLVSEVLDRIEARSSVATAVGVASMMFGATVAFGALQDSLNAIWGVRNPNRNVVKGFLLKRLLSFAMVLVIGLLLLTSLVLGAVVAGAAKLVPQSLPAPEFLLQLANFVGSAVLMTVLFAVIYKMMPDAVIHWADVWIGSAFTAFLFVVGKTLIGLYLGHTTLGSAYGAAGSLVVLLAWMYYSARIFLIGAEFTQVYAEQHGHSIRSRGGKPDQDSREPEQEEG